MSLKRCILYYPTISIPPGTWLRQSLLYWDEIGSIVPQRYDDTPLISYNPDIQYLNSVGAFRPFRPDDLLNLREYYNPVSKFEEEFKAILSTQTFQNLIPPQENRILVSKIHFDKVSYQLADYLIEKGLAKRAIDDDDWYEFEDNTALLYMAILAKFIADTDVNATVAGTDRPEYDNLVFHSMSEDEGILCLTTSFWETLPVPREDVPLSSIIEYKFRRRDELLNFRKLLDEFQADLKACSTNSDVKQVAVAFGEKVEVGLSNLDATLNDARIPTIAGSLKTIISINSPILIGTAAVIAGQASKVTDIPLAWTLSGIGISGVIGISTYLINRRNEKRATLRESPFAYLYSAKQEAIFRR